MIAGLDAWVEKINAVATGPRWTRQDLVKRVLAVAIEEKGEKGDAP